MAIFTSINGLRLQLIKLKNKLENWLVQHSLALILDWFNRMH